MTKWMSKDAFQHAYSAGAEADGLMMSNVVSIAANVVLVNSDLLLPSAVG